MGFILRDKATIKSILLDHFESAGFSNLVAGTPEHALWNILTDNLFELYSTMYSKYSTSLPFNAESVELDLWAEFFGNPRGLSTYTQDLSLTNVYFYIEGIERADLSASDITIPAGTAVSAGGVEKFFKTTEDVVLTTSMVSVFAPVRADRTGGAYNVNANELTMHNLDLTLGSEIGQYILVNNKMPITSGQYSQNDLELRESLQDVFGKSRGSNLQSISDAILDLAGISAVSIYNAGKGTGTFTAFIDSVAPIVSPALVSQAQSVINEKQALGVQGYVKYPSYKAVQIKFELLFKNSNVTGLQDSIETDTQELIMNTINNLGRGESLDPASLLRIILDH